MHRAEPLAVLHPATALDVARLVERLTSRLTGSRSRLEVTGIQLTGSLKHPMGW